MLQQTFKMDETQYEALQKSINDLLTQFSGVRLKVNPEAWYDNQEFMQMMFISKRTAQHYRDSKIVSFSQVGNKIYYKGDDIIKMLESNYFKGKY